MQIQIPRKAENILKQLEAAGYEAYVVGGCVRDAILGRVPGDWDITTSARPEEIKKVFRYTVDTGIQHGTVTVLIEGEPFEVTTYRIDGEYEDARHPKEVAFTASLQEDLRRRDFTINAMAYHPDRGLVDLYGGIRDLQEHQIRCVGCAEERFGEDALRILRALRFASQLDFDIEEETRAAIRKLAGNLAKISAERIQKELTLLLLGKRSGRIRDAYTSGVTAVVLPELDAMMEVPQNHPYHCYTVGEHCIRAMEQVTLDGAGEPGNTRESGNAGDIREPDEERQKREKKELAVLKWTMLLHDVGKPRVRTTDEQGVDHFYGHAAVSEEMARKVLHRLKFDNYTCDTVFKLIKYHDYPFELTEKAMRRAINRLGEELPLLLQVQEADMLAQAPRAEAERSEKLTAVWELYRRVKKAGSATSIRDLAVTGRDLMELGVPQGKQIGELLAELLEQVLEQPERNEREWLLEYVRMRAFEKTDK